MSIRRMGILVTFIILIIIVVSLVATLLRPFTERDYARNVKQVSQFRTIETGLDVFREAYGSYPPSSSLDAQEKPYCGAMKLCEALVGQDKLGFHKNSCFRQDGMNSTGRVELYSQTKHPQDVQMRIGLLLPRAQQDMVHTISAVYGTGNTGPFANDILVLCDTYEHTGRAETTIGMPVLYYRARPTRANNLFHKTEEAFDPNDNLPLLHLGVPFRLGAKHPLAEDPALLHKMIVERVHLDAGEESIRYSYVLLSSGRDGLYGTDDDILSIKLR